MNLLDASQPLQTRLEYVATSWFEVPEILDAVVRCNYHDSSSTLFHVTSTCPGIPDRHKNVCEQASSHVFTPDEVFSGPDEFCAVCVNPLLERSLRPVLALVEMCTEAETLTSALSSSSDEDLVDRYVDAVRLHNRLKRSLEHGLTEDRLEYVTKACASLEDSMDSVHPRATLLANIRASYVTLESAYRHAPCPAVLLTGLAADPARALDDAFEAYCRAGIYGQNALEAAWRRISYKVPFEFVWAFARNDLENLTPELLELHKALDQVFLLWERLRTASLATSCSRVLSRTPARWEMFPPSDPLVCVATSYRFSRPFLVFSAPEALAETVLLLDASTSSLGHVASPLSRAVCDLTSALAASSEDLDTKRAFLAALAVLEP